MNLIAFYCRNEQGGGLKKHNSFIVLRKRKTNFMFVDCIIYFKLNVYG